jgi:hypothetical protein
MDASVPLTDAAMSSDAAASDPSTVPIEGASRFHCVNWADTRDNFVDGLLQLSGLNTTSDTYATVQAKAEQMTTMATR